MQPYRSPPKYNNLTVGGSSSATASPLSTCASAQAATAKAATATATVISSTVAVARSPSLTAQQQTQQKQTKPPQHGAAHSSCRTSSTSSLSSSSLSLYSNSSNSGLLQSAGERNPHSHSHYHHHHHHHNHHHGSGGSGGGGGGGRSGGSLSSGAMKRGKKQNWGTRERAGMSFLIVIAFFAVFGLIILTEVFMIDERSHGGMMVLRHGGSLGSRLGDSMPDYDNAKDDYDMIDDSLLSDNKLGFVQFQDNKLKIQDADVNDARRLAGVLINTAAHRSVAAVGAAAAGGVAGGGGVNSATIPWGKVLPSNVEETLPRFPTGTPPTDGSWQVVNGTRFKFFVFSAYYDRRDGAKLVRVIGATKTRSPERVFCRFWYLNRNASNAADGGAGQRARYTSATVMARVKIIRENWNLKYSACFVLCPIRGPELEVPHYVSIVLRLRAPPANLLELRNTDWDPDFAPANRSAPNATAAASASSGGQLSSPAAGTVPTGEQIADKIAICVKPFHFNYDQALYLMEYLEFYALLGVAHFTFYNHTIGPHATCVLQHYMDGDVPGNLTAWDVEPQTPAQAAAAAEAAAAAATGGANSSSAYAAPPPLRRYESTSYAKPTINILPWNLRMRSQKEIRTEGLFAALNDCLYRTMYRYRYLALVDLDEFIVPRRDDTLNELIASLNHRFRNRNTGAFSFQNAFFYLQFADDPQVMQYTSSSANPRVRATLVTQKKTRRRFKLHPQKQRSKYICKPEAVVEAGNHFVWEFAPGKGSLNVPPIDAILQHYRVCEFGGNDCIKAPSIVDRTANKYVNRLVQRVDSVYKYLKGRCDLPDLPVLPEPVDPPPAPQSEENIRSNNEAQETKTDNDRVVRVIKIATKTTTTTRSTTTTSRQRTTTKSKTQSGDSTNADAATTSTTASKRESGAEAASGANANRQHKMIVFEENYDGLLKAKVQFVDK